MTREPLLVVDALRTQFETRSGVIKAVNDVSFELGAGETLGIVGESGSGKSVTALSIMGLIRPPGRIVSGRVLFKGRNLVGLSDRQMQTVRGAQMAMIFQDPMTSLNPVYRVGWQVAEPLRLHRKLDRASAAIEAVKMLTKVGIPDAAKRASAFPHQFSGGMRQRAIVAMGITTAPSLLIADEPTTALDVTVQAQILELLRLIARDFGTATVLITHNLGVVAGMCDRMLVMYAGRIVEYGSTDRIFARPQHPYTWSLLRSMPRIDANRNVPLRAIDGVPPNMARLPPGCSFQPRCSLRVDRCSVEEPSLKHVAGDQFARCWVTQSGRRLPDIDSPNVDQ